MCIRDRGDSSSMRSGGEHSSASDSKDCNPSTGASALPMHVGYFFRSNIRSVVDYEEIFWAHQSCMEWSVCTAKGESENPLILVAKALTQVLYQFLKFIFIQNCCPNQII